VHSRTGVASAESESGNEVVYKGELSAEHPSYQPSQSFFTVSVSQFLQVSVFQVLITVRYRRDVRETLCWVSLCFALVFPCDFSFVGGV
jgi:hypothetical protein